MPGEQLKQRLELEDALEAYRADPEEFLITRALLKIFGSYESKTLPLRGIARATRLYTEEGWFTRGSRRMEEQVLRPDIYLVREVFPHFTFFRPGDEIGIVVRPQSATEDEKFRHFEIGFDKLHLVSEEDIAASQQLA